MTRPSQNPYSAPQSTMDSWPYSILYKRPDRPFTLKIIGAIILLIVAAEILSTAAHPTRTPWTVGISAMILFGLWRGMTLAWQWAMFASFIGAFIPSIILAGNFFWKLSAVQAGLLLIVDAGFLAVFFLLFSKITRPFFALKCPSCSSFRTKSANFFYTRSRCRKCSATWHH